MICPIVETDVTATPTAADNIVVPYINISFSVRTLITPHLYCIVLEYIFKVTKCETLLIFKKCTSVDQLDRLLQKELPVMYANNNTKYNYNDNETKACAETKSVVTIMSF